MKRIILAALIVGFLALAPCFASTYDTHTLVSIDTSQKGGPGDLYKMNLNIVGREGRTFKVLVTEAEMEALNKQGFPVKILWDEMEADIAQRAVPGYCSAISWPCYYNASAFDMVSPPSGSLMEFLLNLNTANPAITRLYDIGDSEDGAYDIIAMKVSLNPDAVEAEPKIRLYSNIHGDEVGSLMVTCDVLETVLTRYAASDPDAVKLVNESEMWFIPMGNPWGMANSSRFNVNGIDPNRNFWGPNGNEEGTPFSEAETAAIRDLTEVIGKRFVISLSGHGGAIVFNSVYNYTSTPTTDEPIFFSARTGGPNGGAMPEINGLAEAYELGNTTIGFWHTNGADWYITRGDTNDWAYNQWTQLDTTLEVTATKWPDTSNIPAYVAEHREAYINYMLKAFQGIHGVMTEQGTGTPLDGTVTATATTSTYTSVPYVYQQVYTDPVVGDFHRVLQPGTYSIECNCPGYAPTTVTNIVVVADTETFVNCALSATSLKYSSLVMTDVCSGTGSGGDGILDAGENALLTVTLSNPGSVMATTVTAELSTLTAGVSLIQNSCDYPDIAGPGTAPNLAPPYEILVGTGVTCGTVIDFDIHAFSDQGDWWDSFSVTVGDVIPGGGTLLSENFDSASPPAFPAGWSVTDISGTAGDWDTNAGTVNPSGGGTHSGANLAYFNSWTSSAGSSTRLYRTSGVDLSTPGLTAATLSFWMYHEGGYSGSDDRVQPEVSVDGGSGWLSAGPPVSRFTGAGWLEHTADLSTWLGQADLRVAFLGISDYGNDIHIDDVTVTYTAPGGCNMTPCIPSLVPPGEVSSTASGSLLVFTGTNSMSWENETDSDTFNLYRGDITGLAGGNYGSCQQADINTNTTADASIASPGTAWFYIVTGANAAGEGMMGYDSAASVRVNGSPCL